MINNDTEIAAFQAIGFNRMTVTESAGGVAYTFNISGRPARAHALVISVEDAVALAEAILHHAALVIDD